MPKPPNQELIDHEKRRKIESQLFSMGKKWRSEGKLTEDEIKVEIGKERQRMLDELKGRATKLDLRDQH